MLLKGYQKEIFRPECNASFQSLHCIAHLDEDVSQVFPYLNNTLWGDKYCEDPPSLTLKVQGKLITLYSRKIAINALKEEAEAEKLLQWLKHEINETWEKKAEIPPRFDTPAKPVILEVLKNLPKTNCGLCGQPTCMRFAVQLAEGAGNLEKCVPLEAVNFNKLQAYLDQF